MVERLKSWLRWDPDWGCRWTYLTTDDGLNGFLNRFYAPAIRAAINQTNPIMAELDRRMR